MSEFEQIFEAGKLKAFTVEPKPLETAQKSNLKRLQVSLTSSIRLQCRVGSPCAAIFFQILFLSIDFRDVMRPVMLLFRVSRLQICAKNIIFGTCHLLLFKILHQFFSRLDSRLFTTPCFRSHMQNCLVNFPLERYILGNGRTGVEQHRCYWFVVVVCSVDILVESGYSRSGSSSD